MNINQFVVFEKIAQFGNVSRAASELFISQQALSATIKNLEEELGKLLFIRSNKGVKLTSEGEQVLAEIKPLLEHFNKTIVNLSSSFQLTPNEVKIGVAQGVLSSLGQDVIGEIYKEFPNIGLSLIELPDLECEKKVNDNWIDFALSLKPTTSGELNYIHLKTERMYAIMSKENPLSARSSLHLEELVQEVFINLWEQSQFHNYTIEKCLEAGFIPNVKFECFELTSILDIVEENSGIFLGIENIKTNSKMIKIPIVDDTFLWKEGIVYSNEAYKNSIIKQIIMFIMQYFEGIQ